jgi:hypothetical protein
MGVMLDLHINGSIITISLIKLAHLIKPSAMIMVLGALHKLNAKIVFLIKDVGPNKKQKYTQ